MNNVWEFEKLLHPPIFFLLLCMYVRNIDSNTDTAGMTMKAKLDKWRLEKSLKQQIGNGGGIIQDNNIPISGNTQLLNGVNDKQANSPKLPPKKMQQSAANTQAKSQQLYFGQQQSKKTFINGRTNSTCKVQDKPETVTTPPPPNTSQSPANKNNIVKGGINWEAKYKEYSTYIFLCVAAI